jgi:hypothetical protein
MGVLDGDAGSSAAYAGSHPVAAGRRHCTHTRAQMRARIGGVGISLKGLVVVVMILDIITTYSR